MSETKNIKTTAIAALVMFAVLLAACGEKKVDGPTVSVVVIQKSHKDAWTQFMPVQVGKVTTMQTIHHPEKNRLAIQICDSEQWVSVSREVYDSISVGDHITVAPQVGESSGDVYGWEVRY